MIENYILAKKIDGWSTLNPARKREIMEQARYNHYVLGKHRGKMLLPFLLLFVAGLALVSLVLINHYLFGGSKVFYLGSLLIVLIVLTESIGVVRTTPLIDEIKKCMSGDAKR